MKIFLRILFIAALIGLLSTAFFLPVDNQKVETKESIKIVTTIFPAYDFTRTISKGANVDIELLIKPGSDLHSYEPTPQDIIAIKEANIFIYNGGESEAWIEDISKEIDQENIAIVRMMDYVELKTEEDSSDEYDEHIWTSPLNALKITESIAQAIKNLSPDDSSLIQHNLNEYKTELKALDQDFRTLAEQKTGTLIVADRFPFKYFIDEYHFDYLAAFPGCSEQTEASAKTIATLTDQVKQNPQKIIFKLELSNSEIAQTIANSTGAKILTWHSVHNISQSDFDSQKTYLTFMRENLENLSEALDDRAKS